MRLVQIARTELEHLDEARFVERRIGIRRTHEARHTARERSGHFRFERRLVFVARFAQARGQVDQTRRNREAFGIDRLLGTEISGRVANGNDLARRDKNVLLLFGARCRIDQRATLNMNLHALP